MRIGPSTAISQQSQTLAVQDLAVGQEVALGSYDPVTLLAGQIDLEPPKSSPRASLGR